MATERESPREITRRFEQAQDRLVLQASDLSLEAIAAMVEAGAIDVAPEFQRRERWVLQQQSALIESFLLNIPVPPVYLSEDEFGSYSVIDGKQRISAVHQYMRNNFALTGLTRFAALQGLRFHELPPALRNALQVRPYIRAVTLLRQSDAETKYEVFHRLNSGGEPLNAQEIRNVIYRGPLNDLIMELSDHPFLRLQLKIRDTRSPAYRLMQDAEYVLRFLTLRETWKDFQGDFRRSMDQFMDRHRTSPASELKEFRRSFNEALADCEALWGSIAFRRADSTGYWRDQFLGGMYDAQMIAVDSLSRRKKSALNGISETVIESTLSLFNDTDFDAAIRTATNTPSRIYYRVSRVQELLSGLA